ncbi:MAG TPA: hypothetical protein VFU36_07100 [Jatrophihabitans sp.]|nr:hypothetical protein [Jatrophihabitans sp.]
MLDKYLGVADAVIRADFERMHGFAHRLRELAQEVGDRSGFVHCEALDRDLTGHLHEVEKDWTKHRLQVQSFLCETADSIDRIVAEYEKTNDTVASAATCR